MAANARKRRRVVKPSPAPNYDRSMDAPGGVGAESLTSEDEQRLVELDDEATQDNDGAAGGTLSKQSYLDEKPPHY